MSSGTFRTGSTRSHFYLKTFTICCESRWNAGITQKLNLDGTTKFTLQPFGQTFTGGIRVATGDVNGDKVEDIIIAPGKGGGSVVKVLNGVDASTLLTIRSVSSASGAVAPTRARSAC